MATLLWSSSDAEFNLELRCGGEPVTVEVNEGAEVSHNGEQYLSIEMVSESQKGKICEIRILHVSGPPQKWILLASHPN
jgi:hypothetical protein